MTTQIELWQLVLLLLAFFGGCGAAGKLLLDQIQKGLDLRFTAQDTARATAFDELSKRLDGIEQTGRKEANEWQRMERNLLELKADLPLHYVRREDYIRGQSIIESKLDGLAMKLENTMLRNIVNQNSKGGNNAH
jgi:hypothetical protein